MTASLGGSLLDGDVYEFADPCPPSMRNVRLGTDTVLHLKKESYNFICLLPALIDVENFIVSFQLLNFLLLLSS